MKSWTTWCLAGLAVTLAAGCGRQPSAQSIEMGGVKLEIDPQTEHVVGNADAMKMFRREYRKPWVIEDTV